LGSPQVNPDDIRAARERIGPYVRRTPVLELEPGAFGLPCRVTLKLELMQHTGSFKTRGAFNKMLASDVPADGVIAASGGNFGLAWRTRHVPWGTGPRSSCPRHRRR
jgi:threonine dehydratase